MAKVQSGNQSEKLVTGKPIFVAYTRGPETAKQKRNAAIEKAKQMAGEF